MIILRKKPDNMQINVLNRLHYSNINKEHKYRKEEWVPLEICVPRVLDMKMMNLPVILVVEITWVSSR